MTVITESQFSYGDYHFTVKIDSANLVAYQQRDVYVRQGDEDKFIASFYFDDISESLIRAFCERYAQDSTFQAETFARKTAHALRNDLFLRNCANPYFQDNPVLEKIGSMVQAYQFFDTHTPGIIRHPDYQRIYQEDMAFQPQSAQFDPEIADIVVTFDQIEGVQTLASCQGVSGTVRYQNTDVLTVAPHARYAYIWFAEMPEKLKTSLQKTPYYRETVYPMLQSRGDNAVFLEEVTLFLKGLLDG